MENFLWYVEVVDAISLTVLTFSGIMYYGHLAKIKKQRKLSTFESAMHIIIGVAMLIFAISLLIQTFA